MDAYIFSSGAERFLVGHLGLHGFDPLYLFPNNTADVSLEGNYMGSFSSVISEIKSRSLHFNAISFVHEGRSSNMEAHGLARATVNHDVGRHIWLAQAPDFFCIPMNINVE
jgi:hypothetical protein